MALTNAQIFEHIGRMFRRGVLNLPILNSKWQLGAPQLANMAKDYRLNDPFGTLADRTEAMRTAYRFVFQQATGRDPTVDVEFYKNHWLNDLVPGEQAAVEP